MPDQTEDTAAALKARRGNARKTTAAATAPPPDSDVGVPIGQGQPARRFPLLGDPREPFVLGASGMTLGGDHGGKYVRAEVDGVELVTPKGCQRPVSRQLWKAGQMVLRTAYDAYVTQLAAREEPAGEKATP